MDKQQPPNVMNLPIVQERLADIQHEFDLYRSDTGFFAKCLSVIDAIDTWKYSTGPIFDPPPFHMEVMGSSPGRPCKTSYSGFHEARLQGVYSSGFIAGEHRITVNPSKPAHMPLNLSRFQQVGNRQRRSTSLNPAGAQPPSAKPPTLLGLAELEWLDDTTILSVGVGKNGAFSVELYLCDPSKRPASVHMYTPGIAPQSDCWFHYDDAGRMVKVTASNGAPVWPLR